MILVLGLVAVNSSILFGSPETPTSNPIYTYDFNLDAVNIIVYQFDTNDKFYIEHSPSMIDAVWSRVSRKFKIKNSDFKITIPIDSADRVGVYRIQRVLKNN